MRAGKLIALLQTFSSKELKSLQDFANSPYFNKNETVSQFLAFTIKHLNKWTEQEEGIQEEKLFAHLFPNQDFDKYKIYYLRSDATLLIEQFVVYERVSPSSALHQTQLLQFYLEHDLGEYFEPTHKKLCKQLDKPQVQDGEYYYHAFMTEWTNIQFQFQEQYRNTQVDLSNCHHLLDNMYCINKLSLYFSYSFGQNNLNWRQGETLPLTTMIRYIDSMPTIKNTPFVAVFYSQLQMFLAPNNDVLLQNALNILLSEKNIIDSKTASHCLTAIQNALTKRINNGRLEYENQLFQVYELRIEKGLLLDEKQEIPVANFRNVVVLALRLKKFDWAEGFIQEYEKHLPNNMRPSVIAYIWAKFYFEKKDFKKVIKMLNQEAEYPDVFFDLNTRKLLMQTYYELGEIENVISAINSFRVFLSRNKITSESHKLLNQNFASVMNKLATSDISNHKKRQQLQQLIVETKPLGEKNWFLEKVGQN